jgi:two-component system, chemotaxis family, protein-glutamate methylesterase/glutaminase
MHWKVRKNKPREKNMPLRTLIVDDTVTYRKILSDILKDVAETEVIGTAPSGAIALKKIAQDKVHLVFLDVHMPEMDGVETLKRIKKEFPGTVVVMISGASTRSADTTIEALQLGAIDFIRKPDGNDINSNRAQLTSDILAVLKLIKLRNFISGASDEKTEKAGFQNKAAPLPSFIEKIARSEPLSPLPRTPKTFGVCVIGVSTGGPEALSKLVPAFKGPLPVPILCVQHMPPMFTKSLAESLQKKSKLPVVEASENEEIRPGIMYIAPGGRHMVVRVKDGKTIVGINDEPPVNSCRPSVDVLFRSIAEVFGGHGVLSVVLTGMGNDGCNGVRALKRHGCYCITQSEQTCVVYGMPRAVDEAGLSDRSLALDAIPGEIETLLKSRFVS